MPDSLAGIVLAAGGGTRLSPLTRLRPKALCPVGDVALVDRAIDAARRRSLPTSRSTSTTGASSSRTTWRDGCTCPVEDVLLGTAGALGNLRTWIDGRDAVVVNADLVTDADARELRWRRGIESGCACSPPGARRSTRTCGSAARSCRGRAVERLDAVPSGLYRSVVAAGRRRRARSRSSTSAPVAWFDCGTPAVLPRRQPVGQRGTRR